MKKSIAITKIVSGIIIMLIIIVSLDISNIFPIGFFQNKLKEGYKFIVNHSQSFFLILGVLFIFYFLFDIISYFKKYSDEAETVEGIHENQITSFTKIETTCKELESQVNTVEKLMFQTKTNFKSKTERHLTRINNTLNTMNTVYDRNLSTYYQTNKKLYHIASKTTVYSKQEIKTLIDQYQNIEF